MVDDPAVTQLVQATVDAYVGITNNYATKTGTINTAWNLDMFYDWYKSHKTKAGSEVHPSREETLANADGTIIDIGDYSIVVGNGGILRPGTKFRSLRTTGSIIATGTGRLDIGYQDAAGKSILIRLGEPQTSIVYDTGAATTYAVSYTHLTLPTTPYV